LCDPNSEVNAEVEDSFQQPKTSVARTLYLCLIAFRSLAHGQE
jgi:ribosomal protein S14